MKPIALAIALLAVASPAAAYPVNFGNAYVNTPGHGIAIVQPTFTVDGSGYADFNFFGTGLAPGVGLSLESTFVSVPAFKTDWANTLITLLYNVPSSRFTLGPVAGIKTGAFGRSFVGARAFLDLPLREDLTLFTTVGYYYSADGQADPHRGKLDASLDYHGLPGWDFNLELMSGSPNWDYGPATRLALAPGLARNFGSTTVFASLRVPLLQAGATPEAPIAIAGVAHGW
ncbi:MAG: hypothetical protein JWM80_5826 [Cyanobacteria bacterium RYN_339]|nr:hypothetical protein [Cyanobacteria bacterium RYN_339]